jgi:RNA polymerase sigma-70 factor (ECF subfamily)
VRWPLAILLREPGIGSFVQPREYQEDRLADTEESDLIARLRAQDPDALGEVFRRLGEPMTTLAASMLRDRDEANDVVEDALLRVHRAAPGFRGERGLRTWVLRIVANLCRDRLRRRKFIAPHEEDEDPFERAGLSVDPIADWDDSLDQRVLAQALERALAALPVEQREILVMRHRLGLSHAEIVEALGVPSGTVKSRIARALAALRERVTQEIKT